MKTIAIPDGISSKLFVMERGALKTLPEVLHSVFPDLKPWIIADANTWTAAGHSAAEILRHAGFDVVEPYIFPGSPVLHPDKKLADTLVEAMPEKCVPVAVGSGVINDLVKCAAGSVGIAYCCCPTAASVDGYTSSGAAMSVDGMKVTVPCPAPLAIVSDIEVLNTAPPEMAAAGYADLFAKVTGGADWIIADVLGEELIDPPTWKMVHEKLRDWISDCNDKYNIFMGLAATGYAMQMYKDSRPASGAEHLMSHIWEMEGLTYCGDDVSHGFKVGIGMIAETRLMEFVIATDAAKAAELAVPGLSKTERWSEIDTLLEKGCYGSGIKDVAMNKFLEGEKLSERREQIRSNWDVLREKLKKQLIPSDTMIKMMSKAGCPVAIKDIGLDIEQFIHAIRTAQLIRKRYTVLDLLYEAGILEAAIEHIKKQYV